MRMRAPQRHVGARHDPAHAARRRAQQTTLTDVAMTSVVSQRLDEDGIGEEGVEVGERDVAGPIGEGERDEPADRQHDEQAQHGREQRHHRAGQVEAGAGGAGDGCGQSLSRSWARHVDRDAASPYDEGIAFVMRGEGGASAAWIGHRRRRSETTADPSRWTHRAGVTGRAPDRHPHLGTPSNLARLSAVGSSVATSELSPWRSVLPLFVSKAGLRPGGGNNPGRLSGHDAGSELTKSSTTGLSSLADVVPAESGIHDTEP